MVWSQMAKILIHIASLSFMIFIGYILYPTTFVSRIVFIFFSDKGSFVANVIC